MHFRIFLRNKKAQEGGTGTTEESGNAARSSVIGFLMAVIVIYVGYQVMSPFVAHAGGEMAKPEDFMEGFLAVANGSKNYTILEQFGMKEEQLMAVFGSGAPGTKSSGVYDTCQSNEWFYKPEDACGGSDLPCICICNQDDACKSPHDCKVAKNAVFGRIYADADFDANLGDETGPGEYPLIYGNCDGWGGEPVKIRNIIIESVGKPGEGGYIFITDRVCGNKGTGICSQKKCSEIKMRESTYKCPLDRPYCCV